MADFLNRLAARALGATPLAEPVIPTRFSSGPEQSAFLASESAFPPTRPAPETYAEASEDRPPPPHSRDADPGFETVVDRHALPFQDMDEHPYRPLSQRPRVSPPQAPSALFAERETVQPSPERAEARRQHPATAMDPPLCEVERPVAHRPQTTSPAQVPFAEPQPAPRLPPHAEPMRGQPGIAASRIAPGVPPRTPHGPRQHRPHRGSRRDHLSRARTTRATTAACHALPRPVPQPGR